MLVAVTAVLVGITAHQVWFTREVLELTRDAVVASQKEAEATAALVNEAVRARVDQRTPGSWYVWSSGTLRVVPIDRGREPQPGRRWGPDDVPGTRAE